MKNLGISGSWEGRREAVYVNGDSEKPSRGTPAEAEPSSCLALLDSSSTASTPSVRKRTRWRPTGPDAVSISRKGFGGTHKSAARSEQTSLERTPLKAGPLMSFVDRQDPTDFLDGSFPFLWLSHRLLKGESFTAEAIRPQGPCGYSPSSASVPIITVSHTDKGWGGKARVPCPFYKRCMSL